MVLIKLPRWDVGDWPGDNSGASSTGALVPGAGIGSGLGAGFSGFGLTVSVTVLVTVSVTVSVTVGAASGSPLQATNVKLSVEAIEIAAAIGRKTEFFVMVQQTLGCVQERHNT
ncbi:hypothetical protein [Arthrobacter monumenti]